MPQSLGEESNVNEIPNMLLVTAGESDTGICHDCGRDCTGELALGVVDEPDDGEQEVYCRKCAESFINQTAGVLVEIRNELRDSKGRK